MCDKAAPFLEMFIAIPEDLCPLYSTLCENSLGTCLDWEGWVRISSICEGWLGHSARYEIQLPFSPPSNSSVPIQIFLERRKCA